MKRIFNLLPLLTAIAFLSLLMIASCSKEKSSGSTPQQEQEASQVSSESDAEADLIFNGVFDNAMGVNNDVGIAGTGVFTGKTDTLVPVPRCFTVTITRASTTALFPVHIVIDFGTAGCPGPDGHLRRGKIIIDYTNRLTVPGATATARLDGFYVDSTGVQGTLTITNASANSTRIFKVDVTGAKLTRPNGNYTEWTSHKTITQIEGMITPDFPRDDIFRIEGNANGHARRGNLIVGWESVITEPLIKRFTCQWVVKGKIRTVRVNSSTTSPWVAVLDFGAGGCDDQAIVTINGVPHQITLP